MMGVREIDRLLEQWQMGNQGFASADYSGTHAKGAVAGHLVAGPRLDSLGISDLLG